MVQAYEDLTDEWLEGSHSPACIELGSQNHGVPDLQVVRSPLINTIGLGGFAGPSHLIGTHLGKKSFSIPYVCCVALGVGLEGTRLHETWMGGDR